METFLLILIFASSIALIAAVLAQDGKNAGMGSSFGGSSEKLFGRNRARGLQALLQRVTVVSGVLFMLMVVIFNIYVSRSNTGFWVTPS